MADVGPIVAVLEHQSGELTAVSRELTTKARELGLALGARTVAVAFGPGAVAALGASGADEGVAVTGAGTEVYVPATHESALNALIAEASPALVLMANTTMGMDLGAACAAANERPMVAYVASLTASPDGMVAICQVYGGKLLATVEVPPGSLVTVLPGSWQAESAVGATPVREVAAPVVDGFRAVRVIEPDTGDVDITRADILVSIGRGIEDPDNIPLAEELAEALGGVVSCSRPVVDAGWLPRARQVGKSGQTVKPKLYLALGISGAPEHLQGMRDADLIVAVNSDPSAPIFEVAHYGATVDMLDLMPALTERLREGG